MIIEPSDDGPSSLGKEPSSRTYQLPNNSWVLFAVESNSMYSLWSYFWLDFGCRRVCPAWYRVFPADTAPSEWRPVKAVAEVIKRTGVEEEFDDDKDYEEARREREAKVGAAEKLPAGRYVAQAKIRIGEEEVELEGIEFQVERGPLLAGWG